MRAMILLGSFERGGAESVACELVRRWALAGTACVVASMRRGGPMKAAFESAGGTVYDGLAPRRWAPGAAWRLGRLMRRHGTDVLIVVDPLRNGLWHGLWGALLGGGPATICWCHSSPHGQGGRFVPRLRAYRRVGLLDLVVCVSRHQRSELTGAGLGRRGLAVAPNGLDLAAWTSARPADDLPAGRVVLSVANAMPDKDFATLADAMRRLAQRREDVRLVLVGRGTDSPAMREAFAGLEGRVSFLGQRDDVPALLAGADALVLSSRSETFGLAVLEAMAAGVPVVATDLPAVRELAGPDAAVRVPPGDAIALAEGIERVLDEAGLSADLAAAGARRARRFDSARMADRMARLAGAMIRRRRA